MIGVILEQKYKIELTGTELRMLSQALERSLYSPISEQLGLTGGQEAQLMLFVDHVNALLNKNLLTTTATKR